MDDQDRRVRGATASRARKSSTKSAAKSSTKSPANNGSPFKYPYIHPEHLKSEHLAVRAEDLNQFIDHYGDEGPDIITDAQPT